MRPDVALKQVDAETPAPAAGPSGDPTTTDDLNVTPKPKIDVSYPDAKTRFYGVKTLNADKIALDFKNIADEVIAHLRADISTTLTVKIEIEATDTDGVRRGQGADSLRER